MSKYVYKTSLGWEGTSLLGHVCEGWGERVEEGGDHVYPETVLDCAGKPERRQLFQKKIISRSFFLLLLFGRRYFIIFVAFSKQIV